MYKLSINYDGEFLQIRAYIDILRVIEYILILLYLISIYFDMKLLTHYTIRSMFFGIIITLLCSLFAGVTFAVEKWFWFGISDSDSEDDTIVARKDLEIGWVVKDQEEWFVDNVVKSFINWILWILGLIALIMCLYGWFMMLTARDNEDIYSKWFTILKNAIIWLLIIWTAWLIVSLVFWLVVQTSTGVSWAGSEK